ALFRVLELGNVRERADQPHHFAVGTDDRARLEGEPEIVTVRRTQAEILHQPATALLQHAVERGAETIAVERMQDVEPARSRSFERATLESERSLGFRTGKYLVGGNVPVPDHVAGTGERERPPLHVRHDAVADP